jgi:hypothetical protein
MSATDREPRESKRQAPFTDHTSMSIGAGTISWRTLVFLILGLLVVFFIPSP